jgi:hypothetical protein
LEVVLTSFHSVTPYIISEYEPEVILIFDSHLDNYLATGVDGTLRALIYRLPDLHKYAVLRPSAHVLMRELNPNSLIYLVIPECCYREVIRERFGVEVGDEKFERVSSYMARFINEILKIEVVFIPPQDVKVLLDELRGSVLAIDIDVDYLAEFSNECYTPPPGGPGKCNIGTLESILGLIKELNPPLITISEFTLRALSDSRSHLTSLIKKLRSLGYRVRRGYLVPSDREAMKAIDMSHRAFQAIKHATSDLIRAYQENANQNAEILEALDSVTLSIFLRFYGHLIKEDRLEV